MSSRPIALLSLSDFSNVRENAQALTDAGWTIVASRETVDVLQETQIPVTPIEDYLDFYQELPFPPTLHPQIEHALTMDADKRIDMVYVVPYQTDIGLDVGGRTLLALAAKGERLPVMTPADFASVVAEITAEGEVSENTRSRLIRLVYTELAQFYGALSGDGDVPMHLSAPREIMHGENPYQESAALYQVTDWNDPLGIAKFAWHSETLPCFTNLADMDALINTMVLANLASAECLGAAPHVAIGAKHGNPVGMAFDDNDPGAAIERALFGSARSVWGGEFIVNFPVDAQLAERLVSSQDRHDRLGNGNWMLDVVCAPSFTDEARAIIGKRRARKVMENPSLANPALAAHPWQYRHVRGGFLRQPIHDYVLDFQACERMGGELDRHATIDLLIAWSVAWTSNHGGNEVALTKDGVLLACAGGPSTVEATQTTLTRARANGHDVTGAAFAANAFFPFTDGPELLCAAGVTRGLVPAGGRNEDLVRKYFSEHGVFMVYLPGEYRGFSRH